MIQEQFQDRKVIIQGIYVAVAVLLILKCMQLQLFDTTYREQASANVIQKINKYPSRGLIYDRNMKLLVNNEPIYDLMVIYNQVKDIDTTKFCNLLGITKETFETNLNKNFKDRRYSRSKPFIFLSKISDKTFAKFQESLYEFPGFYPQIRNVRGYNTNVGAHVLGYTGEVSERGLENNPYYRMGDFMGISGLERTYEKQLRGERGVEYVLRDNLGRVVGSYNNGKRDTVAASGKDLITTLDIDLQAFGEELMQNKRGAIVAIEPSTGEILSLVSSASYDPNLLSINRQRGQAFQDLAKDSTKPLYNRAITEYPPGSTFKPLMALIAMQEDVLHANRSIGCPGAYYYKSIRVGCHGHGAPYNVARAIQFSCNAYFCQVFRDIIDKNGFSRPNLGLDTLVMHTNAFGLGQYLNTDVENERKGMIPTSEFYNKMYREGVWASPYIISVSIGQGEVLMTPLQMANMTATIANKGYYYTPHLAKSFKNDTAQISPRFKVKNQTLIDREHFIPVIDGMEGTVLEGTARVAQIPGLTVCGKTGTVENPHGKDHSSFIAFAPKENPKIAIAVYVEHGGYGATHAAPIASLMIEKYMNGEIAENRQYLVDRMKNSVIKVKTKK